MGKKKQIKKLKAKVSMLQNSVIRIRDDMMQNASVETYDFGKVTLEKLCRELPGYIDNKIKAAVTANNNRSDT